MQFQWRSVSDSLLLSPLVRLRFHLDITCPQTWTQLLSYASCQGILQHKRDQANPYTDGTAAAEPEPAAHCLCRRRRFLVVLPSRPLQQLVFSPRVSHYSAGPTVRVDST